MDMDKSAVFLAGSILIMLGFIVIVAGVVAINNLLHKYWKPVTIFTPDSWQPFVGKTLPRYATEDELANELAKITATEHQLAKFTSKLNETEGKK